MAALGLPVVVLNIEVEPPWKAQLRSVRRRYSTIAGGRPFDTVAAIDSQGPLHLVQRQRMGPYSWDVAVDDYIASFHARSSLTRARLGPDAAAAFDTELAELLAGQGLSGRLSIPFYVDVGVLQAATAG